MVQRIYQEYLPFKLWYYSYLIACYSSEYTKKKIKAEKHVKHKNKLENTNIFIFLHGQKVKTYIKSFTSWIESFSATLYCLEMSNSNMNIVLWFDE
jgi:hypothetical protein